MTEVMTVEEAKAAGVGLTDIRDDSPKITYWTPDGRQIRAIPSIREYILKDANGKVIRSGERDANLDNGWLLQKPEKLKMYCPNCDKWHDTQKEITACGKKKADYIRLHTRLAKKEIKTTDDDRISKVESDVSEIKNMLKKLLEK